MSEELKHCPFCGKVPDLNDDDTLYPNGTCWTNEGLERVYFGVDHPRYRPGSDLVWSMNCPEVSGGCGAEIKGDSRNEAIANWQRRV